MSEIGFWPNPIHLVEIHLVLFSKKLLFEVIND
jgi:hypothetical protein